MRRIEKMNAQVNSWFSHDVIKIKIKKRIINPFEILV